MKFRKHLKCYRTLYTVPGGNTTQIDTFLDSLDLPTLNEEQNQMMIADINEGELTAAIRRLKLSKSPGSDGYTAEWYKKFRNVLTPVLLLTLNWALKKAQTPPSWKEVIISTIPKEGKDKLECGSFRPISVLKKFTSIMAKRLEEFLPTMTIMTRRVLYNNAKHNTIYEGHYTLWTIYKKIKIKAVVIRVDAEKAFDSVSWDFFYRVLHRFGLHDTIIKIIKALYAKSHC